MSTIKSSNEHLTFNADGTSKEIRFQANGTQKASISSAGLFTSTTIDATKLTGALPAISGANLTGVGVAGISSSADATAITISSAENVGIGATSPSTSLHLKDNATGANTKLTVERSSLGYTGEYAASHCGTVTNNEFDIHTNNTVRMRIKSDGKVGIGDTAGQAEFSVVTGGNNGSGHTTGIQVRQNGYSGYKSGMSAGDTGARTHTAGFIGYIGANHAGAGERHIIFETRPGTSDVACTERMRIKSDGDILMNSTSNLPANDNVAGSAAYRDGLFQVSRAAGHVLVVNIKGTTGELIVLRKDGSIVGTITTNGSSTSYNTSSDHRLKENVVDMENATDRVKQLKPKRFNFIADDTTTVDGFIAHEVSSIVPEAISGEKDAVDDDGNAVHQGIDQSKLVPLLVKTIQELEARITAGGL